MFSVIRGLSEGEGEKMCCCCQILSSHLQDDGGAKNGHKFKNFLCLFFPVGDTVIQCDVTFILCTQTGIARLPEIAQNE